MASNKARKEVPVDGVLYFYAKKQAELLSDKGTRHNLPEEGKSSQQQTFEGSDEVRRSQVNEKSLAVPKGILKVPTVRFDVDAEEPENRLEEAPGHDVHPYPPPRPPPPPPPPPPLLDESQMLHEFGLPHTLHSPPPPPLPHHGIHSFVPPPPDAPRPPSLFTKNIEANEYLSEAAFKLYTQFFDQLSAFVDQQARVVTLRLTVQEKRTTLKHLREDVSRCDVEFITSLRQCVATEVSLDNPGIMALFEAAQAARDLAGPAEAEYEPMEVGLGAEEHKLTEMYAKLGERFEQFFRLKADPSSQQSLPTKIEYEEPSEANSVSINEVEHFMEPRHIAPFHGAWIGEQVAVGQVPVRAEEALVESVQRQHRNTNRPASSSEDFSKQQLSSIAAEEETKDELPTDLAGIAGFEAADAVQIEGAPTKGDVMRQGLTGLFADTFFGGVIELTDLEDDLGSSPFFELSDTLLLSALPPDQDNTIQEYLDAVGVKQDELQEYLKYFENTRDRVNRWILHQVRLSRREVFGLQREVTTSAPKVDQWANMVLDKWSSDALGQEQPYSYGSIEGDTSINAAHHHISPHLDELAQEYLNRHGDRPSYFMSNRVEGPPAPEMHSQMPSESAEAPRPHGPVG